MKILILEPFLAGSHASWANEYARLGSHETTVLGLEGRHWKWRMHGGAVTLARLFLESTLEPDIILASDMCDLAAFLALTRERTAGARAAVYFHENQLTYPWSERDPDPDAARDAHYGFINITSALAAGAVLFNSRYHLESFCGALKTFLGAFPDNRETGAEDMIRAKSSVLPLGLDLGRLDALRPDSPREGPPLVLWNHRWEYDKNPGEFFRALFELADGGLEFRVAVLGERFREAPPVFDEAVRRLGDRIVRFGRVDDFGEYAGWLWKADILPVTSIHDFFGASVVQAIYCNCCPLLPNRLAYPEHIPSGRHGEFLYEGFDDLLERLRERIVTIGETRVLETQDFVKQYDWRVVAPRYDDILQRLFST